MLETQIAKKNEEYQDTVVPESCQLINEYSENLVRGAETDIEEYIKRYQGNKDEFIQDICFADLLKGVFEKEKNEYIQDRQSTEMEVRIKQQLNKQLEKSKQTNE